MDPCHPDSGDLDPRSGAQRRVLARVLGINAGMFVIEVVAGVFARSTALLADSLDMLGDAIGYGLSLYAVGRGSLWAARAATAKGLLMALLGLGVFFEAVRRQFFHDSPDPIVMLPVAALALAANLACSRLLHAHRQDDLNLRSSWIFTRVDVLANLGTLLAAGAVWILGSAWPDMLVGVLVAGLVLRDAVAVLRAARAEIRNHRAGT